MKLVNVYTSFIMGAAVGAAASFYILKKKYDKMLQEDHEQFRKDLDNPDIAKFFYESALKKQKAGEDEPEEDIPKPFKRDKSSRKTVDYTSFFTGSSKRTEVEEQEDNTAYELTGDPDAVPVVISPDEYGDDDTYAQISLLYTTDGVLIDENDEVFESTEALCPDFEEHFDEYEADAVCMRNDRLRSYYEILKSLKSSKEILRNREKRDEPIMVDD